MEGLTATPSVERKRLSRSSYNWPFDKRLPPRQPYHAFEDAERFAHVADLAEKRLSVGLLTNANID